MKLIKTMTKEELLMGSVDLISKTYIELGQTYKNFYFEDAQNAFSLGVRSPINDNFIHFNVPTYMKWLRKHKDLIWDARSKVDRGEDPKSVPHYRPEPKLLK